MFAEIDPQRAENISNIFKCIAEKDHGVHSYGFENQWGIHKNIHFDIFSAFPDKGEAGIVKSVYLAEAYFSSSNTLVLRFWSPDTFEFLLRQCHIKEDDFEKAFQKQNDKTLNNITQYFPSKYYRDKTILFYEIILPKAVSLDEYMKLYAYLRNLIDLYGLDLKITLEEILQKRTQNDRQ